MAHDSSNPKNEKRDLTQLTEIPSTDTNPDAGEESTASEFGQPADFGSGLDLGDIGDPFAPQPVTSAEDLNSIFATPLDSAPGSPDSGDPSPQSESSFEEAPPLTFEPLDSPDSLAPAPDPVIALPETVEHPAIEEPPAEPAVDPQTDPTSKIRKLAERTQTLRAAVPAQFPFSLLIEGHLEPVFREKLLDLLTAHSMGVREMDLEPQLEAGRILIPQISEYAGVLLVQALRGTSARMSLGPSEEIFSRSQSNEAETSEEHENTAARMELHSTTGNGHPAENIPVTTGAEVPHLHRVEVLDTITASVAIPSKIVHAQGSADYQEILEKLTRELKYKAYRKGATALVHFTLQLVPLSPATHYRAVVMATGVREARSHSHPDHQ